MVTNSSLSDCQFIESPTLPGSARILLQSDLDGTKSFRFVADPGLYQLSLAFDGSEFDWEQLYINIDRWSNHGERTGPWDFSPLDGARPVVPAYWIELDGQRLGLWHCQRVPVEDIPTKRFRGRLAFLLRRGGEHALRMQPYRPTRVRWLSATLETDPEDRLLPALDGIATAERSAMATWGRADFWPGQRALLAGSHAIFRQPLNEVFDWAIRHWTKKLASQTIQAQRQDKAQPMVGHDVQSHDIFVLLAAHELAGRAEAMDLALRALDVYVNLPHWGNPQPDSYGHDGDMFAADAFRNLAWAYHALRDHLGEERRSRLVEKLRRQGQRFLNLALLMRDYWGGSLLQDHGRQSLFAFGTGALHLLGVIPEADVWVRYALPRLDRAHRAIPRDGVVPTSSHHSLTLYLDEMCFYRDALLAQSGRDIYDEAPLRAVVDYLEQVVTDDGFLPLWGSSADGAKLQHSQIFLNHMARKYRDGRAATIQRLLMGGTLPEDAHPMTLRAASVDRLWGFLTFAPEFPPAPLRRATRRLVHLKDSGVVYFRDDKQGLSLALRCGPWVGQHAWNAAPGPCDRMEVSLGPGHFNLWLAGQSYLVSPDGGYRLRASVRNCLLIDDSGPYGDIGYPMSLPSWRWRGERIENAEWDEPSGTGMIRLNLQPAYAEEAGVVSYTREFRVGESRLIHCEDHVELNRPRRLTWLFHTRREQKPALEDALTCRIGSSPCLRLRPSLSRGQFRATIAPTPVVRSYGAQWGYTEFEHVRYETAEPLASVCARFVLEW